MAKDNKTQPQAGGVKVLLDALPDERRKDCKAISAMMRRVTGKRATLWGTSMVGFGQYYYRYASGREGVFFRTGFASRKSDITVYIHPHLKPYQSLLKKLGPHKHSVSCLYIKRLSDIDTAVLEQLIKTAYSDMQELYPLDRPPPVKNTKATKPTKQR